MIIIRSSYIFVITLLFIPFLSFGQESEVDTVMVFYLGGQSNMNGFGYNKELPDSLNQVFEDIMIYQGKPVAAGKTGGGTGIWDKLKPGHGYRFSYTQDGNKLSNRFGVELSFAKQIQQLYPDDKIALIKYAVSGTSIDTVAARQSGSWEPDFNGLGGINQYDNFLATLNGAFNVRDIDGDGKEDYLKPSGIIWMQGESDAFDKGAALRYHDNLKRLMDLMRAAFRVDDLPVVIGKISDSYNEEQGGKVWPFGELVQHAQEEFVKNDSKAAIVRTTSRYGYSDPFHYDSNGFIDLGIQFANTIYQLKNQVVE